MNTHPTPSLNCTNIKNLYRSSEKNTQEANHYSGTPEAPFLRVWLFSWAFLAVMALNQLVMESSPSNEVSQAHLCRRCYDKIQSNDGC